MSTLYLLRHSEIDPTTVRHELSYKGKKLAFQFGRWLLMSSSPVPLALFSSDRPRATQTAAYIAQGLGMNIGGVNDNGKGGLILTIDNSFEESNPPKEIEDSAEYINLHKQGKRASLLVSWPGKEDKAKRYREALENVLRKNQCSLLVSHANAIQQLLDSLFGNTLNLSDLNRETPHLGLTVITMENNVLKLDRLFSLEWQETIV